MLDMVDIGEFSRHQAWWTVGRCGCGALGANRVCRFVVGGENSVCECPKSCKSNNKARIASNPCSFTCPVRGLYLPPARSAARHRARMCQ